MGVREGWEPGSFGDALAGSGGMTEPSYPSARLARVYSDALSARPLGGMPLTLPPGPGGPVPSRVAEVPRFVPQFRPPPANRPMPVVQRNVMPTRAAIPPRSATPPRSAVQAPGQRPWPQFRAPGQPVQYMPVPTSAQLAPGGSTRPPAYLPPGKGLAQVRSAVTQARAASARRLKAARPRGKKSSGAWGFVVFVVILLVTSGAGQKIISLITELFQRK